MQKKQSVTTKKSTTTKKPIAKKKLSVVPKKSTPAPVQKPIQLVVEPTKKKSIVVKKWDDDQAPIINKQKLEERKSQVEEQKKENNTPENLEEKIKLEIRARFNKIFIQPGVPQTIPGMISLTTQENYQNIEEEQPQEEQKEAVKEQPEKKQKINRLPIDLVCVIDRSYSMVGEKIDLVRKTLLYIIEDLLDKEDRISLIQFDDTCQRLTTLLPITDQNKQQLLLSVKSLQVNGGTDIVKGLKNGIKQISDRKYQNPVTSLFLLSDGLDQGFYNAKQFQSSLENYTQFTIHTFGFGQDHDPKMMQSIASKRDGSFYFIDEIDRIDEAFVNALAELFSVLCQNIQISLKINDQEGNLFNFIKIVKTYGDMWKTVTDSQSYQINLQNIISGISKNYIFEFQIPGYTQQVFDQINDNNSNQKIMNLQLTAEIYDIENPEKKPQQIKIDTKLVLQFIKEELNDMDEDGEVMENYYRVKGAEIMDEGMKYAEEGKMEEGEEIIKSMVQQIQQNPKMKDNENLKKIVSDLEETQNIMKDKQNFHKKKGKIINMKVAHMYQKGQMFNDEDEEEEEDNFNQGMSMKKKKGGYQNAMQLKMVSKCKKMKK